MIELINVTVRKWSNVWPGALTRSANGYWHTFDGSSFVCVKPIGAAPGRFHDGCAPVSVFEAERFARMEHPGAYRLPALVVAVAPSWGRDTLAAAEGTLASNVANQGEYR
jgi:hypothetical protein